MADSAATRPSRRRVGIDLAIAVAEGVIAFLIITLAIGRFEIHSVSMEPNLHEGQLVVVSKLDHIWPFWLIEPAEAADDHVISPFAPHRGQIVVFYQHRGNTGTLLIKRLIGLPGDTIVLSDGHVVLNGTILNEPYVHNQSTACFRTCGPIVLGSNQYFFMGDNRSNSLDSRIFGPIPANQIIGPVVLRYWPLNQITFNP